MDAWKRKIAETALRKGIIDDPTWLDKLDEPIPAWAVLQMMLELLERLEPNYTSYD